jgi:hypothetical protein
MQNNPSLLATGVGLSGPRERLGRDDVFKEKRRRTGEEEPA